MSDNQSDNSDAWATPKQAYRGPEPDCRTCASYGPFYGRCNLVRPRCTNGDSYQPLPPVRLWRTDAPPTST